HNNNPRSVRLQLARISTDFGVGNIDGADYVARLELRRIAHIQQYRSVRIEQASDFMRRHRGATLDALAPQKDITQDDQHAEKHPLLAHKDNKVIHNWGFPAEIGLRQPLEPALNKIGRQYTPSRPDCSVPEQSGP